MKKFLVIAALALATRLPYANAQAPTATWKATLTKIGVNTAGVEFRDLTDADQKWADSGGQTGVEPAFIHTAEAQYGHAGVVLCVTDAADGCFFAIAPSADRTQKFVYIVMGLVANAQLMPIEKNVPIN